MPVAVFTVDTYLDHAHEVCLLVNLNTIVDIDQSGLPFPKLIEC